MVVIFLILSFIAFSGEIVPTINVGIILDLTPSFSSSSNSIYKSFLLAFSNHTNPLNERIYNFINKNITSLDECQSVANFVFSKSVSMTFAYVNSRCLEIIYKQNIEADSFLIVPSIFPFSECIENSVFSGLYVNEIFSLLTQLYGDIVILGYENDGSESLKELLYPSNNYNIQIGLYYHDLIQYSTSAETVLKIKDDLPNGGIIISLLLQKDTDDLLNEMKVQLVNNVKLYSIIDSVRNVYQTNRNAIGQYLFVDYIYDIRNTEFNGLYEDTYGDGDDVSSVEYFSFYMVKHWLDALDKIIFYDPQIIMNVYRSDIVTPEITLYFNENNFYYGDYYLYQVNDRNELEYKYTFGMYCTTDDRAFTPIITNITHQNLCNTKMKEVKYYVIMYNYYMAQNNVIESSLDIITSELKRLYDEQDYYMLRIIESVVPETIEELKELIQSYSEIYKVDTIFGAVDSDLLVEIVPLLESLDILFFSVEENEGNICSSNVVFYNSGIYTQFRFFVSANYAIYNPPDLNRMYVIYSEGRYGDFFYELSSKEQSLHRYDIVEFYQLKKDSSNLQEILDLLHSQIYKHLVLFAVQGKISVEFFKKYNGNPFLRGFVAFSHSTPYKIFAFKINFDNFYFISIYSNDVVDSELLSNDYYYMQFNMNYTIDYRIGKHLVDNLKDSYGNCTSYNSTQYKRCFKEFPSTVTQTSIGYNFQAMGTPNLLKFTLEKMITIYTNCPFPTISTSFDYNLTDHTFNVCNALEKTVTKKSIINVYIIFTITEPRYLDLLYSLFYMFQNTYSKERKRIIPLIFPTSCTFGSLVCYMNVFKKLKEENTEISYLIAPFTEELMYALENDIKSVNTRVVNTWWYSESLCQSNYINMGDSLEQSLAGISNLLIGNEKIYEENDVNLCIVGEDDIYTNGVYKYMKGDILLIKYKIVLYVVDDTNVATQLNKINTECVNSFLISTLITIKNDNIIADLDKDITFVMIRNDEGNILDSVDKYNNSYIISTYSNNLNNEENVRIHKDVDSFSYNDETYNTSFPFSRDGHFFFPTFMLNYYITLEYIKNDANPIIKTPKGIITLDENPSIASNVFVIKIVNSTFIVQHNSTIAISPFLYTTYDENNRIVYPEDIINPSNLKTFVYKCNNGTLYQHNAYNSLYLYDENDLHDLVTLYGVVAAVYDLISSSHIYIRIIPFTFKADIPSITYKPQLDELLSKYNFTSIIGCYFKDCLEFFNNYLVEKDIPLISPYQSNGEMCLKNVIIGGTIISQEIMSLFYLLQNWTLPVSIVVDTNNYPQQYISILKPYLVFFDVKHFIYNITTTNLTPLLYHNLFEVIRRDINNGGLIVLLIDNTDVLEKMILCFYRYIYDDNSDLPFYLLVNDSPDFLFILLRYRISYNHIYFQINYNPRLNISENLHYLNIIKSHIGIDGLFDDNSAIAYSFVRILYKSYKKSNTTSFLEIKNSTLVGSYDTAIGPIQITKDLYTAQMTYLRTYNSEHTKIVQVNENTGIYIPTPYSSLYHHKYYICVNGEKEEFANTIRIGVIHPYSGYYKEKYSSVIYALTLASDYFVNVISDDVKYVLDYYNCGDDLTKFKNILHRLVEQKYVAVFGGYPSAEARNIISEEINNKNTSFYYLYDVNYPECYSNNFIILGTVIHQKLIAIAQYLDTTPIRYTILLTDKSDLYVNDAYIHIMKTHFMDRFVTYSFSDTSKLRLFFDAINDNYTEYAFVLHITSESSLKFYNELYQYSILYPYFEYVVFDLNMDYFEALQYPVEYLMNSYIMSNYLPCYNLAYDTIWTNSTIFSYINEVNLSSLFYIGSYLTDFYYEFTHIINNNSSEKYFNFSYYSPEGLIYLDKSNYLTRNIRIGKFYSDSNRIKVKLEYESDKIKPDPYYLYFERDLEPVVCNVYNYDNTDNVVIKKVVYINDNSNNIFDIYTGMHFVLAYEYNKFILNANIIDTDVKLSVNEIRKFAEDEDVVAFIGCTKVECIRLISPILAQYNKLLLSFYDDPGVCNSHIISTVNSKNNRVLSIVNHFYSRNMNYFILLTDNKYNVYSNMFRSYCKVLGVIHVVVENPTDLYVKDILDKLISYRVFIFNTISYLTPSVFNFLSSKSEDTIKFSTINLYDYYYNSSYYVVNVYSIENYVIGMNEMGKDGFEEGFRSIYNHIPNKYNFMGYNAMKLLFRMIKTINNFDILSNLDRIDFISRFLSSKNPLYLLYVNENREVELIKTYNSTLESYYNPYPWLDDSQSGSICVIDIYNKTSTTKRIDINRVGLTFNINEDDEMIYSRQVVLTIVNAISYYYLIYDLNVVITTFNCVTDNDFKNAYNELMKYEDLKVMIGGLYDDEYKLVEEYIRNTNVLFFSVHPIPECVISKNMFSSTSANQIAQPIIDYILNKKKVENIAIVYSHCSELLINNIKKTFHDSVITYYLVDSEEYTAEIDRFMNEYLISNEIKNIICMLHKDMLRYFANSVCSISINNELKYTIDVFYCDAMGYALKDIGSCKFNIHNYLVGTYYKDMLVEKMNKTNYIFDSDTTDMLMNNYYPFEISSLPFNEKSFMGLVYVEFLKYLLTNNEDYTLDNLPIYNYSFLTPYGRVSMSVANTVSRVIYYIYFSKSSYSVINSKLLKTYEICFKYNQNVDQYSYVDYYNNNEKSPKDSGYVKNVDVFQIGFIFESPLDRITPYEKAFYVSIERFVISINNDTGLMNKYLYVEKYYYKDIISSFSNLKTTIFFSVVDYSIVSQYFLPLLYLTNKIMFHLLPFSGEVCENNIIFTNYFSYEIGYHVSNFILYQNKDLTIIYSISCSDIILPLYNQLSSYPYTSVVSFSFDINDRSTFTPIHTYLEESNDIILLIFGPVLFIDDEEFKVFIKGFNPNSNMIITDLSSLQISDEMMNLMNGFYFFSSYFQSLGNESNTHLNINLALIAEEVNNFYFNVYSKKYRVEYPSYIALTTFLILKDILYRTGKYEIDSNFFTVLNQRIGVLSAYGQCTLTPGRKLEQLFSVGRYNSVINDYEIIYFQETPLFPYNFNPYLSDQKCLFNVESGAYNYDQIKLLFIFSSSDYEIGIDAFLAFLYQLNEINNENIYINNYIVYCKKYKSVDELKLIVTENQEKYFAYIAYINPSVLEEIRYDFNRTILFSLAPATKESMLQSNIISFSLVDSVAVDVINDQLEKLFIDNILLISMPNCPIYLFCFLINYI